jgi:hypothetical protein
MELEDIAETTKNFMESVALLGAGTWAVLQFLTLRHDQRVKEQSILCIDLEIKQATLPEREGLFLSILVKVKNQGTRNSYLQFNKDDHLTVTPVSFLEDGTRKLGDPIKRVVARAAGAVKAVPVLSGAFVELPFFVPIPARGLYAVRFYVEPNEEQRRTIVKAGGAGERDSIVISTNKYVVVDS